MGEFDEGGAISESTPNTVAMLLRVMTSEGVPSANILPSCRRITLSENLAAMLMSCIAKIADLEPPLFLIMSVTASTVSYTHLTLPTNREV